jgi:Leucine-rich repeat (LRR) protein
MVEPMAVSIAGTVASKLLEQVMEATKIAINCNKYCKDLHTLLKQLQPIVDHAVCEISQSNFDNAFKRPRSAVHDWLDELEGTLKRAAAEVNKCIKQQPDLNPVSRHNTGKRILDVTESVRKLLQQAGLVGLAVTLSESSRAQKMMEEQHEMMQEQHEMMQEEHEMMDDRRATALRIQFANFTHETLEDNYTTSGVQRVTSAIKSAFYNLLQNLSLGPSDKMSRVDTGASSSSSCPQEQIVNEDAHKLTDVQQVPQPVFGLDNFTMRLQQSITSSRIDAEPRCVGVWGMGGAGKTLLAQIAYNSKEVREHFRGGKLIWLTVSQTPNIKELYDSLWRQLCLMKKSFAQLEEYRTRLYNEFLRRRVFLVLDDVWNIGVLEQLDLAKGRGSVTLVTTRNRPVLKKAGVIDEDEVKVGVLSKEDSWKLFCVHAFRTGFSNIPCELQGVAELVADECKGLPLALKVIGGSMVGKTTRQEWEFQLNCLWESRQLPGQQEEAALFGRLKLSYDNLDKDNPILKECFLGFAAFPEDRMVEMEELVKLWKAQGLLDDPTKKLGDDPTLSAYYVVGLLIGRSLIEVAPNEHDFYKFRFKDSYRYKVHDVMRDLALHILEGQRPISCLYRPGKKLVEFPGDWIRTYEKQPCEVRNLSLMDNVLTTLNGVTFFAPKLEVLLLAGNEKLEAYPREFLKGIENLKVLDLSNCRRLKSVPKEIGKLTQLTHLYLANCRQVRHLPVGKLTQLIHLDLSWCRNLKLPKSIRYLQRLQWLDLTSCHHPLPSTMGDLKSLEYLSVASESIYEQRGERQWKLGQAFAFDICKLTTLTKLRISGDPGGREIVGLGDQLLNLVSKLVKLKSFHMYNFHALETLPDAIQSMVHLEEFWVMASSRITIPSFITLFSKLKVLKLQSLSSLYSLPALNTLKVLSTLTINGCRQIEKLPDSFTSSDAFPSLKELDCSSSGLVEFSEVEDGAMPMLQILNLHHTHIKNLPNTLIYLKNLKVVYICEGGFDDLCKKFENSCLSKKFSHF